MKVKHYTLELSEREVQLIHLALLEAGDAFSARTCFAPDGSMMLHMASELESLLKFHNIFTIKHLTTKLH